MRLAEGTDGANLLLRYWNWRADGLVRVRWPEIEAVAAALIERETLKQIDIRHAIRATVSGPKGNIDRETVIKRFMALRRYPFTRAMIERAPEAPGVYGLFDAGDIIYIGKAINGMTIKNCLLLHHDGSLGQCGMKATAYTCEITNWPHARETELLAAFFKAYRQDPRCQGKVA